MRMLCLRGGGKANVGQQELRRKKRTTENEASVEDRAHAAQELSDKGLSSKKYIIGKTSNRKVI